MTDEKADAAATWREERRAAAAAHGELLADRQRAESARAQEQIDAFLRRALASGPAPVALSARSYDGRARYRTPLTGWYLRRDETVAVDTDGKFYVLTTPSSLTARFRGVTPEPSAPPLVIGAGGKDGESLDMSEALARVLGR
ncbi:hypothetical protein HP550_04370 [Cellulomonas humilata]|uniref:Uncharacterized protein n=1 Tax=Cellulomonas humilata TaxID=144055 RepID=A0A7Y6DWN5_9CELL|nr:hypothetical protein [Cellulomonas humilata]